jgi:hypothetical protein
LIAEACALEGCFAAVPDAAFGAAAAGFAVAAAGAESDFGAAGAEAAGASTARTAPWQAADRLDMFFCRHCSEASPPGGTLEQCAI